jgi:alpha-N-acetylglucosaminidase
MNRATLPTGEELDSQLVAAMSVAQRVLGQHADSVRFRGLDEDVRSFEYRARSGVVEIAATDGVSACVGLHTYLRAACGRSVSWDSTLPLRIESLPDSGPVRKSARVREGFYFNFCTFSYTMAYWDWPDWEREVDWMALHGITMPLSAVGYEAAVILAYKRLGLAEDEIRAFIGGPGYLPFHYMGCVENFAGPLPQSWVTAHAKLGSQVLERQRSLGMTPVVPAFAGNVPRCIAPDRVSSRDWMGVETFFLDPADPLYRRVGAEIARAQGELFGISHYYAADPFIEMLPVNLTDSYPALVASATIEGLRAADPEAVWVTQAWPFSYQSEYWTPDQVRRLLHSVPDDQLLVIDLWGETDPQWSRFDTFDGKPWAWCALLNFGGRTDLIGNPQTAVSRAHQAIDAANRPAGLGVSMEGIRNNTAYFELVLDQIWNVTDDLIEWTDAFAEQRYGVEARHALTRAWRALLRSVYDTGNQVIDSRTWSSVLTTRPSLLEAANPREARRRISESLWYDPALLAQAWQRMLQAAEQDTALAAGPLGHDLVDVAASAMARVADRLYLDVIDKARHADAETAVVGFLDVFTDLDRLLATRPEFSLQTWESQAASWAADAAERAILLDNARRILTVWNYPTDDVLDDYAGRIWAGLVGGYYRERWRLWSEALAAAAEGTLNTEEEKLNSKLQAAAQRFLESGAVVVHEGLGDVVTESRRLFDKYAAYLCAAQLPVISADLRPSPNHDRPAADERTT